jgi:glycine/D-amino acid oxidase-like deaminating enzyme
VLRRQISEGHGQMRMAVLGAGVVGVTCASELMRNGHEVVLADREPGAALGTSYDNAGFVSPGHAYAWRARRRLANRSGAATRRCS